MADNADVRSLEGLEEFLQRTQHFRAALMKELENLSVEMRRLSTWLQTEARQYWAEELTKSQRHLVECQDALTRCMSYVREDERKPCTELKKRLKKAKDRRLLCEERLRLIREACVVWEREASKVTAKMQRCQDLAESDVAVAIHHLKGQIETLRTYAGLRSAAVTGTETASPQSSVPNSTDAESEVQDAKD